MNLEATLTTRQDEVGGLIAIGWPKKRIAAELNISERTVENIAREIYYRTETNCVGEFCNWWFCNKFNLSLTEIYSMALSLFFIYLVCVNELNPNDQAMRTKSRTCRVRTIRRKSEAA